MACMDSCFLPFLDKDLPDKKQVFVDYFGHMIIMTTADVATMFLHTANYSHIHDLISSSFWPLEIGICTIPISQMRKLSLI